MPTPAVVGALLLFRLFYYIIPLFLVHPHAGAFFRRLRLQAHTWAGRKLAHVQ
jgi:uncharacterized membrane protein YbhN (UPF0104 family)